MKTTNIIYSFLILFLIINICNSCEKLLDVDVPDNQMTTGQVFEDVQTANAALAGLYAKLWSSSPISGDQSGMLLGIYTDDLDCYATTVTNGVFAVYRNQQIDTNTEVYGLWSSAYQNVYIANSILEGVENSLSLPAAEKSRIKGEALLARSVLYFYLQQLYGDIPYPVTTDYQINQSLSKTPSMQVLSLLESDLNSAVALLKDDYRSAERIFPNRKAAQLMLAKVYILQNKWIEAEALLRTIIQSPLYQFQSDVTKVFNKSGTHIIWQLKPKNAGDATKEVMAYYFTSAPSNYALTQSFVNAFTAGDLRKQHWTAPVTFNGNTWYRADKYKTRSNNTIEYSIVFRMEEIYLLLAEVLTMQNKLPEALPFVNATRQRAGLTSLVNITSQSALLNEILHENRKEFFAEMGHRFFDLKRHGRLNELASVKANWKDYHKVWPLPQTELLLNPNINPQNQGY